MIWHVITRFGEADTFEPAIGEQEPRIHVGLRRPGDVFALGPDPLASIARNAGAVPDDRAIDLLSIAEAAFAADLRIARDIEADRWTRSIRLHVPVADPERWSALRPAIAALLGYLTGDEWDLEFRQRGPVTLKVPPVDPTPPATKTVCLFSGGLDSLIAGIDLLSQGAPVALVGHYGAGLTNNIQQRVLVPLRARYGEALREFRFFVQPPKEHSAGEPTMRARSILFLALGVAVASALNADRLVVGENGLISLNVPLTLTRLGSNSTRTTHPHVLAMLRDLLKALGLEIAVELPYRFKTKGEMLAETMDPELLAVTAPLTMSCSHPEVGRYRGTTPGNHCGYCVPCIIRRAAFLRAGLPQGAYDTDILTKRLKRGSGTAADLRAFEMGVARFRGMSRTAQVAAVLSTGPIPDEDVSSYADTYARGMAEVSALLEAVPRV
jgi:7-cyano-7-deazaguanine synthase in queuosine biosynthesis